MLSVARTGKVLIFAAGLVAVLDVVGQQSVQRWATSAGRRRAEAAGLRDSLTEAWPHFVAAARLAKESGHGTDPDAAVVRDRARADLLASRTPAGLIDDVRYSFASRERHAQELILSRMPPAQAAPLTAYLDGFRAFARRVPIWTGIVWLAAVPVVVLAFWGRPGWMLLAWVQVAVVAFMLEAPLLSPRVWLRLRLARATVSHRLASVARRLLVRDGRPLRAVALGLFVVGSLLDLIAG